MIKVTSFSHNYGAGRVVDDVSFEVQSGEIVALIGPNGAGKSTTMKVLTTLLRPSAGEICVAGADVVKDPMRVRQNLGYLPETNPLYDDMIVFDLLKSVAKERGVAKQDRDRAIGEAAKECGLEAVMHREVGTLSRGYRQRVGIAMATIHKPSVLILDEATTGLDPNQIREIRDLIVSIGKNRTVLISTHILQEVTAIANRVIVLHHGHIVCDDRVENLVAKVAKELNKPNATIEDVFAFYTMS